MGHTCHSYVPVPTVLVMNRYTIESCVCGYHVYKDIWEARVGEELSCEREIGNSMDPFAVVVVKNDVTIGHIPRRISSVCSLFLSSWS